MNLLLVLLPVILPSTPYDAVLPGCAYLRADPEGSGTAFVVDLEKKLLLTCRHVVGEQKKVELFFPHFEKEKLVTLRADYLSNRESLKKKGLLVSGKVLKTSDEFDLALVEADSLPANVRGLSLSKSLAILGEKVWSLGHRGDVETLWNLTSGTVRQTGKLAEGYFWQAQKLGENAPGVVAQLPIEQGDSGGPMVNSRGEVIAAISAYRNRSPLAAVGPDAGSIRKFLKIAEPKAEPAKVSQAEKLAQATVWVRPNATNLSTAGVVIDAERRWILTNNAGAGPLEKVGVVFPLIKDGKVVGEREAYRDPVGLHLAKLWQVGRVRYRDPHLDLAIVEVEALPDGVTAVSLAEAAPAVGDPVFAIAHPTGLEFAFVHSSGSLRQKGLVLLGRGEEKTETLLLQLPSQGNAAGGPVANPQGELLGILAAKESPSGQVGYAAGPAEVRGFLREAKSRGYDWNISLKPTLDYIWQFAFACQYYRGERWEDAIAPLNEIIAARPQDRPAIRFRALVWVKLKKPKDAIADLRRILEYDPSDREVRAQLAEATALLTGKP